MVLPIIIGLALLALLFTFRDEIKAFAEGLGKPQTEEEIAQDERGAIENTKRFIFGEGTIDELNRQSEQNKIAIDKFILDAQQNLQSNITGVNTTLIEAQKNLSTFAEQSKQTIQTNVNQFQIDVNKNVSGIGESFSQFIEDSRLNLTNIFGGQAKPKAIPTPAGSIQPLNLTQFAQQAQLPSLPKPQITSRRGSITTAQPVNQTFTVTKPVVTTIQTKTGTQFNVELTEGAVPEKKLEVLSVQSRRAGLRSRGGFGS